PRAMPSATMEPAFQAETGGFKFRVSSFEFRSSNSKLETRNSKLRRITRFAACFATLIFSLAPTRTWAGPTMTADATITADAPLRELATRYVRSAMQFEA